MGLDMVPLRKPKEGYQTRFEEIFRILESQQEQKLSFMDKLKGKRLMSQEELLKEMEDISIPSYVTIKAPCVGKDREADEWAVAQFPKVRDKTLTLEQFMKSMQGYYVLEFAQEKEGLPWYASHVADINAFRGEFLKDCGQLIGSALVDEAWTTKLAAETLDYGQRLMAKAEALGAAHNLQHLKDAYDLPDTEETQQGTLVFNLHIVYSLAKWLTFYGQNGHGYEADY